MRTHSIFSSMPITNVLQKYGRPNEATPARWTTDYTDYNAPLEGSAPGATTAPVAERTSKSEVLSAPPVAPNGETAESMDLDETAPAPVTNGDAVTIKSEEKEKKRKSKHEGETAEERAERKRRKKEKKEKKEKRKSKVEESEESD